MNVFAITLLLVASCILAAPALNGRNTSFSLPAIHRRSNHTLHKRDTGSVKATQLSSYQYSYLVPVTFGGQRFNVQLDTGTKMTWVFGSKLPLDLQIGHRVFDESRSTTWKRLGFRIAEEYVDGDKWAGRVGTDIMKIAGIKIPTQPFGVADTLSDRLALDDLDGILGLSFASKFNGASTFADNVIYVLDDPVFAIYYPPLKDGFVDFGKIIPSRYEGTLLYSQIDLGDHGLGLGLWTVASTEYMVGGVLYKSPGVYAIIDTNTDLLHVESAQAYIYYSYVPGYELNPADNRFYYPCGEKLPDISLLIGDNFATIPGANLATLITTSRHMCLGGIQAKLTSDTVNIYGLVFVTAFYCVFDLKGPQFGFAELVPP